MLMRFEMDCIPPISLRTNGASRSSLNHQRSTDRGVLYGRGVYFAKMWIEAGYPAFDGPVEIRFRVRTKRKMGLDNVQIGYKALIDGLVGGGLIPSDECDVVQVLSIEWDGLGSPRTICEVEDL